MRDAARWRCELVWEARAAVEGEEVREKKEDVRRVRVCAVGGDGLVGGC
jgi:hypothetical protein